MKKRIIEDMEPALGEIYMRALTENGLEVLAEQKEPEGWNPLMDLYLVYGDEEELELAEQVMDDLKLPPPSFTDVEPA